MKNRLIITFVLAFCGLIVSAQPIVVNEIIAVMGNKIVMTSDVEERISQMILEGSGIDDKATKCAVYEELLFQKMLVYRAGVDSVTVGEDQIEGELQRRIDYFLKQFPSQEEMERYLGKTIPEIKKEFRVAIEEQLLVQQMQEKVSGNVKVTPGEVRQFYNKIPKDSLPYIPSEAEVAQIVIEPKVTEEQKREVRDKLNKIRNDILRGSSFALKAKLYSEDKASGQQGGELGLMKREDLVTEFSSAAFRLKPGEVSEIVETEFGFHIIELIEKRGEYSNFRHILLKPEISDQAFLEAQRRADSVYSIIGKNDTLTFEKVALLCSDDKETKFNGGRVFNYQSGSGKFQMEQIVGTYNEVVNLNPGEFGRVTVYQGPTGNMAFRIVKLVSRSKPHVADLSFDYQIIQNMALAHKQNEAVMKYIDKMKQTMYIQLSPEYKSCDFQYNWDVIIK